LRTAVQAGHPGAAGIGALRYHGMLQGLRVMLQVPAAPPPAPAFSPPLSLPRDPGLVPLLANLVLHLQEELTHVC